MELIIQATRSNASLVSIHFYLSASYNRVSKDFIKRSAISFSLALTVHFTLGGKSVVAFHPAIL